MQHKRQAVIVTKLKTCEPNPCITAWTCVEADGRKYLVDSTWGAGSCNGKTFTRRLNDHYFLTPPEIFAFDHLPEEQKYQLLKPPMTEKTFTYLPAVTSHFWMAGLKMLSHKTAIINCSETCTIRIGGANNADILSK